MKSLSLYPRMGHKRTCIRWIRLMSKYQTTCLSKPLILSVDVRSALDTASMATGNRRFCLAQDNRSVKGRIRAPSWQDRSTPQTRKGKHDGRTPSVSFRWSCMDSTAISAPLRTDSKPHRQELIQDGVSVGVAFHVRTSSRTTDDDIQLLEQ